MSKRHSPALVRVGCELSLSAHRAERHELADAVAPVAPLLSDRGELIDRTMALRAQNRRASENVLRFLVHGTNLTHEAASKLRATGVPPDAHK